MRRGIKFGGANWLADLEDKAYAEIRSIFVRRSKIGIACSGGADSVYLLYCIADIFSDRLSDVFVLHYNHKVRVDSDEDEQYVAQLCAKLNLNFVKIDYIKLYLPDINTQNQHQRHNNFFVLAPLTHCLLN